MPAVPWAGRPPVLGLVTRRGVPAPLLLFSGVCPTGDCEQSLTLVPTLPQTPLSRKVHGVIAIVAPEESHALLRRAGGVSRRTIRCMPSTCCQSPVEHVSDETAHTPSLSHRVLAVLQHCVRRFAVASNAEHGSVQRSAPFLEPGLVTTGVTAGPCCTFSQRHLKTTHCNSTWWLKLKDSSWSPLVSSQGVVSPPLSNGCGWELHGLQLYRDQRDSV